MDGPGSIESALASIDFGLEGTLVVSAALGDRPDVFDAVQIALARSAFPNDRLLHEVLRVVVRNLLGRQIGCQEQKQGENKLHYSELLSRLPLKF